MRKTPLPPPASVRQAIDQQKGFDQRIKADASYELLHARVRAIDEAKVATDQRQIGAIFALRQSLVDAAAICESLAERLPVYMTPTRKAA